jgi:hypothetical protein
MTYQLYFSQLRAVDSNGEPSPGALARFYVPGTTAPQTVYFDADLSVAVPQPLEASAAGVFPQVFAAAACKVVITGPNGATLAGGTQDPCIATPITGSAATSVTFAPSVAIPVTNVQAAIDRVQANIAAGFGAVGWGVTGAAPALPSFDDAALASGAYGFDSATPGTRPSGWAGVPGSALVVRNSASEAVIIATRAGSDQIAFRRFFGIWQPWVFLAHDGRIASTAQAEAGISDSTYMTPLLTKEAILAQAPAIASGAAATAVAMALRQTTVISASVPAVTFTGLAARRDVMLVLQDVTASVSGHRAVQVSSDGGSTWLSSGEYLQSQSGTANNILAHTSDSASARSGIVEILGFNSTEALKPVRAAPGLVTSVIGIASASAFNAIRVINTGGGDLTAGTVRLFAR